MRESVLRFSLTLFAIVIIAPPVHADMSAPGLRNAKSITRITTNETFPDQVFVIYQPRSSVLTKDEKTGEGKYRPGYEAEFVELAPNHPVVSPFEEWGSPVSNVLLVVSRDTAAQYQTAVEIVEAVNSGKAVALFQHNFETRETVPGWYEQEFTVNYRLRRDANGQYEVVRTTWYQGYQCCVVAVALPVATLFGGMWLTRRFKKKRTAPPASAR